MFRKTGILVVCLVLVCSTAGPVWAISNAGVLFLRIAAGARAAGMGEAFVAVADDATATACGSGVVGAPDLIRGGECDAEDPTGLPASVWSGDQSRLRAGFRIWWPN